MIFKVVLNGSTVIYDGNNPTGILDPQLEIEINAAGSFTFILPSGSDVINEITPFTSEIDVYEDEEMIWFGRVLNKEKVWNNQCKITCEGGLAYFNDSIQDKKTWESTRTENQEGVVYDALVGGYFDGNGDPISNPYFASDGDVTMAMFFRDLIDWHNGQVSENMQWEVGTIANEYAIEKVWRETNRETTSDCLQTMCLDTTGGYFITRKEYIDDPTEGRIAKRYIDWLDEMPYGSTQNIEFGVNLLDISNSINGADICTVLVPIGADELTINKVPNTGSKESPVDGCYHVYGTDTVIYAESEAVYGRVQKTKTWSDITDKESLYSKAVEYLKEQNTNIPSIECSAAELHYLDGHQGESAFRVGQLVRVISAVHGILGDYPLLKISMSLNSGAKRVTIGTPPKKELTDIVKNTSGSSSRNTSGGSSGGSGGGSGYVGVKDVRLKKPGDIEYESTVKNKVSKIDLSDMVKDVKLNGQSVVTSGQALLPAYPDVVEGNPTQLVDSGDLRKIKIGNHVFSIPEGGGSGSGSGFVIDEYDKVYPWNGYREYTVPYLNHYYSHYAAPMSTLSQYDALVFLIDMNPGTGDDYTPVYTPYLIFVDTIEDATVTSETSTSISYSYNGPIYDFGFLAWARMWHHDYLDLMYGPRDGIDYYILGPLYGIKFGGGSGVKDILVDGVSIVDPTTKTADFDSSEFGTTVEANPSETATDDLTTIKIGDTVYDIPGGSGSGGQQYTCDLLFKNDPLPTPASGTSNYDRTYTLSSSIDDYDAVYITSYLYNKSSAGVANVTSRLILKPEYYTTGFDELGTVENLASSNVVRMIFYTFTDNTHIKTRANRTESGVEPVLYTVYGLKFTSSTTVSYPEIYSEEEREIGAWIDGKPLYQKTTVLEGTYKGSMNNVSIGLENIPIDIMPSITAVGMNAAGTIMHIPHVNNAASGDNSGFNITPEHMLTIRFSSNITYTKLYFTFRYTKTTDQPGSGHWLPGGTTAISYSEDEQIIGTWVDGKTLYQKTFISNPQSSEYDINVNSFNIEKLISRSGTLTRSNGQQKDIEYRTESPSSNSYGITVELRNTNLHINIYGYTYSEISELRITLQYTKTTDDASAPHPVVLATQEELEAIAYHYRDHCYTTLSDYYSEDERVVGRWIDGKPLYQKTFDFSSSPKSITSGQWVTLVSGISSIVGNVEQILGNSGQRSSKRSDVILCVRINSDNLEVYSNNLTISDLCYYTIQYTKTTDTAGTGPTPGNLVYLPALYSEEEREIGVWTDGKPLYQKTIYVGTLTRDTSWHYVNHNISNIDKVISVTGKISNGNPNELYYYSLPVHRTNTSNSILIGANATVIQYMNNWLSPNDDCTVNLMYTKTTDQPGSGRYLPDGQLAHHYMTSEHIVGTWIDGSTLYEITFTTPALTSNSWNENNLPIANVNKIVRHEILIDELQDNIPYTFTLGSADGGRYEAQFWHNRSNNKYQLYIKTQGNVTDIYATITLQYTKT